jgi:hypothetical protein
MNSWQGLNDELPEICFNCIIWSSEVFVLLSQVQSGNQENEYSNYEWHQESQCLLTQEDTKVFLLCLEESAANA